MAKTGRKPKVDAEARTKILAIIAAGASLKDAADYLGVAYSTVRLSISKDPSFRRGVHKAAKSAKIKLIKKVGSAKPWQAAAWMLERRYGAEYGRREVVRQEITGKNGGAIKTESTTIVTNLDECSRRFEEFTRRQLGTGPVPPNGN